jgi:hypothetical protein
MTTTSAPRIPADADLFSALYLARLAAQIEADDEAAELRSYRALTTTTTSHEEIAVEFRQALDGQDG